MEKPLKETVGSFFEWGVGVFQLIMKNKLVSIGCFLVQGLFYLLSPVGSLRWDAGKMALLLAFYALMSLIFVLTDRSPRVAKGQELAGGMVRDYFDEKKEKAAKPRELLEKKNLAAERTRPHRDAELKQLLKRRRIGKTALIVLYSVLLAVSVLLFFWRDITIYAAHIIIGILLILDGLSGISTVIAARKNGLPMKHQTLSLVVSACSAALGVAFIAVSWNTAVLVTQIVGVLLIAKSVIEFIIALRNREVFSSVRNTVWEIRQQGRPTETD